MENLESHGKSKFQNPGLENRISSGSMNNSTSIFFPYIFKFLGATNLHKKYRENCIYDTRNLNLS